MELQQDKDRQLNHHLRRQPATMSSQLHQDFPIETLKHIALACWECFRLFALRTDLQETSRRDFVRRQCSTGLLHTRGTASESLETRICCLKRKTICSLPYRLHLCPYCVQCGPQKCCAALCLSTQEVPDYRDDSLTPSPSTSVSIGLIIASVTAVVSYALSFCF